MKRSGPRKTYKGKFSNFKNPQKYIGNIDNVTYRSMWEKNVMAWLDENPNVLEWSSEELYFPYEHPITGKRTKYYPDFYVKMNDGMIRVIEVKPQKEISKPEPPKRKTKQYAEAIATWVVNQEKWKTAQYYCNKNNTKFEIWSENTLTEMGIMRANGMKKLNESKPSRGKTWPKRKS